MKSTLAWGVASTTLLLLALPFVGGAGPSFLAPAHAAEATGDRPVAASTALRAGVASARTAADAVRIADSVSAVAVARAPEKRDTEHIAQKPVPVPLPPTADAAALGRRDVLAQRGLSCPGNVAGASGAAPSAVSAAGVGGTTSDDIAVFAAQYNQTRVANCLTPVPLANFRYDSCMEARLFWMAEDPSTDPSSAWGHMGSQRSDGVASVGCDGNLAGGMNNTGQTVASKWWASSSHRTSLYKPTYTDSTANVCIFFAMTHGGIPDEPYAFTRAAARWMSC